MTVVFQKSLEMVLVKLRKSIRDGLVVQAGGAILKLCKPVREVLRAIATFPYTAYTGRATPNAQWQPHLLRIHTLN